MPINEADIIQAWRDTEGVGTPAGAASRSPRRPGEAVMRGGMVPDKVPRPA